MTEPSATPTSAIHTPDVAAATTPKALRRTIGRTLLKLLVGLAVIAVLFVVVAARAMERHILYQPHLMEDRDWSVAQFDFPVEDVWFTASDGVKLHGWYVPSDDPAAWTLLWSHGNGGNITNRHEHIVSKHAEGYAFLIYDYRGYGKSEGSSSEDGLYRDGEAAFDWLVRERHVDPRRIALYGLSLGSAIATETAVRRPAGALIVSSPFTSIPDMARPMLARHPAGRWIDWLPPRVYLASRFDSLAKMPSIHCPVLVIHGTDDGLIPIAQGRALFAAANEPKEFYEVAGSGHYGEWRVGGEVYKARMKAFLAKAAAATPVD